MEGQIFNLTHDKFQKLIDFLLKHQRAIEYSSNDLRASSKPTGKGLVNHTLQGICEQAPETTSTDAAVNLAVKKENTKGGNEGKRVYCWIHQSPQHDITECNEYNKAGPDERMDLVRDYRICWSCLRSGHFHYDCYRKQKWGVAAS